MASQPIDPHTADEWRAEEKAYVLHTWTAQSQWNAPTVTGGSGAWFWDDQGRRYLDLSAMAECSHLGHQHPAVIDAIKRQADEMMFVTSGWGNRTRALLAKKIVEHAQMPGGKVFFALGGAEANENAIKMARWVTGRHKVITRHRSYHGATAGAMELSGDNRGWNYPPGPPGVVHALPPYCYRCPFGLTYPGCGIRCADHIGRVDRVGRAADRRGGAGRAGRRDEWHHRAAGILAAPARDLRSLRRAAHRRRGDERVRADRRVVRVAGCTPHPAPLPRRRSDRGGETAPGHDDAGERLDGGVHAAGRGRRQQKGGRLL